MTENQNVKLKVIGERTIHCGGCENTVQTTLSRLPGVAQVKADRDSQLIEFQFAPGESELDQVKSELEMIGYEVELA